MTSRITYDFTIVSTPVSGISSVMPLNEEAYNWMVEEAELAPLADGSTVLFSDKVGDFISDSSWAHLTCEMA